MYHFENSHTQPDNTPYVNPNESLQRYLMEHIEDERKCDSTLAAHHLQRILVRETDDQDDEPYYREKIIKLSDE